MTEPNSSILLARQGIYDKKGIVCAYEILYRNGNPQYADVDNTNQFEGDSATSSVLTQMFTNMDMRTLLGNKRAYINFTYNNLIQKIPLLLPKDKIVVEILETVEPDNDIIKNLRVLKNKGYQIALDDFVYQKNLEAFVEIANVIKIEVLNQDEKHIEKQLSLLKNYKGILLAEKIETKEQFQICRNFGFHYFQGFFLNKPESIASTKITENKAQLLRLLAELNDDNVPMERIEEMILPIPKLSYRILRLANSPAMYRSKKIDSLLDAIKQLGLFQIRNWLNLLLLSSFDEVAPDLLERTLIRAKMCESMAKTMNYTNPHQAYTVGILSTLDGILNQPLGSLLANIHLTESLNEAILDKKGMLGTFLKYSIDYEQANFSSLNGLPLKEEELTRHYLQSIEYASSVIDILNL
ncbi:EAL and HDOD domain-containing protein [Legionella worsleiensis]|uniref:Putative Diguanylate phosphodiesterase (EAL domain) n=1 Tax=Legionella worsleiensis TaxID=45076 RepID=A0A0W1A435_9GAMM|nr:HDOD domain-containing protein [Legionella worsleiensis]KTD76125.1 putative Diguanylate phosphodiesterase (EAL domain) [Legionella worsleiensis]STY33297.1 putative signal transduction protein [Legionella worsleiensis]